VLTAVAVLGGASLRGEDQPKPGPPRLRADYKNGFRLASEDGKFSLRLSAGFQLRYSYVAFEDRVKGNENDYSNFFIRRARLWWDGHAFDPNVTYYFHLQLEPSSAVNLHDAWVQYRFSDLLSIGCGRNKIPYGSEFLASGFALNFVERSILSGETDVSSGGGLARWPGGNQAFALSAEHSNTGFPIGGLSLFRSQGIAISGMASPRRGGALQYEVGVWQGRNTKGASNLGDDHLFSARIGYYPFGWVNWTQQGDPESTERFHLGVLGSAYSDRSLRTRDAAGAAVAQYRASDNGYNLSVLARYRGFSGDLEWAAERYDLNREIAGPTVFERGAWRASFGYFVVPGRLEVVARHAEVERLKDATPAGVLNSGLGFVALKEGEAYLDAIEGTLSETTAGVNVYLGGLAHQHKVFVDASRLTRSFVAYHGFAPDAQEDWRLRSMVQLKF